MNFRRFSFEQVERECDKRKTIIGYSRKLRPRIKGGETQFFQTILNFPHHRGVIRIYVAEKKALSLLSRAEQIPAKIGGIETDVVAIGEVNALTSPPPGPGTGRLSSLMVGCSIGHKDITAGSMGRIVLKDGEPRILSNNHVLANVNQGIPGDKIYQPGPLDVREGIGVELSEVYECGVLDEFVPIVAKGNLVDAALAIPTKRSWFSRTTVGGSSLSPLTDIEEPEIGAICEKHGRTTGRTSLKLLDDAAVIQVGFGPDDVREFVDQLMFQAADGNGAGIAGGDSGSLVYRSGSDGMVRNVGLIFAGSSTVALANKMANVVAAFSSPLSLDTPFFGEAVGDGEEEMLYEGVRVVKTIVIDPKSRRASELRVFIPERVEAGSVFDVSGNLLDAVDGTPLANRFIVVNGLSATTNDRGQFLIRLTAPTGVDLWDIVAEFAGD
ncbi:hypothetical protein LCGC14_0264190 [marine sediment metagenome]|uniref:Serine protease n=1 Tax=marine sediment metagenome TaxID=412755 RepID=A0A0F9U0W5_9ZZZZ